MRTAVGPLPANRYRLYSEMLSRNNRRPYTRTEQSIHYTAGGPLVTASWIGLRARFVDSSANVSNGSHPDVKFDNATVREDVYVEDAEFDCTDSTIAGQNCSKYSPKDPDTR